MRLKWCLPAIGLLVLLQGDVHARNGQQMQILNQFGSRATPTGAKTKVGWFRRNFFQRPLGAVERGFGFFSRHLNPVARYDNIHLSIDEAAQNAAREMGLKTEGHQVTGKIGEFKFRRGGTNWFWWGEKPATLYIFVDGQEIGSRMVSVQKMPLWANLFWPPSWGQNLVKINGVKVNGGERFTRSVEQLPERETAPAPQAPRPPPTPPTNVGNRSGSTGSSNEPQVTITGPDGTQRQISASAARALQEAGLLTVQQSQ